MVTTAKTIPSHFIFSPCCTCYVDYTGAASDNTEFNPNGSICAIEGILSPDGRVFGKMGHSERYEADLTKNIPGIKDQKIFESGVAYFL